MNQNSKKMFFRDNILGHTAGLFCSFFTEMWSVFLIMECTPRWFYSWPLQSLKEVELNLGDASECRHFLGIMFCGHIGEKVFGSWALVWQEYLCFLDVILFVSLYLIFIKDIKVGNIISVWNKL